VGVPPYGRSPETISRKQRNQQDGHRPSTARPCSWKGKGREPPSTERKTPAAGDQQKGEVDLTHLTGGKGGKKNPWNANAEVSRRWGGRVTDDQTGRDVSPKCTIFVGRRRYAEGLSKGKDPRTYPRRGKAAAAAHGGRDGRTITPREGRATTKDPSKKRKQCNANGGEAFKVRFRGEGHRGGGLAERAVAFEITFLSGDGVRDTGRETRMSVVSGGKKCAGEGNTLPKDHGGRC